MKRKIRLQEHRTTPPSEDVEKMLAWSPPDPEVKGTCGGCKHFRPVTSGERGQCILRPLKNLRFAYWTCSTDMRYRPCSTCAHWTGISIGNYRICQCIASDQCNKPTYHTYSKCEHHEKREA